MSAARSSFRHCHNAYAAIAERLKHVAHTPNEARKARALARAAIFAGSSEAWGVTVANSYLRGCMCGRRDAGDAA